MRKYLKIYIDGHYQRTIGNTKWFMDLILKGYERDYKKVIYHFITCIPSSEERTKLESMNYHVIEIFECHFSKGMHIKKVDKITCLYIFKGIEFIPYKESLPTWKFVKLIYIPKEKELYNLHNKVDIPICNYLRLNKDK